MISNLVKEHNSLKHNIIVANRLYYLLILYSDENIPLPDDRNILEWFSITELKYNIHQMQEYLKDIDLINEKLMINFNNIEYCLEKDELDYLLDNSEDYYVSSIDINEIPSFDTY